MGLAPKALPELFGAINLVGVGLRELAIFSLLPLFGMSFFR